MRSFRVSDPLNSHVFGFHSVLTVLARPVLARLTVYPRWQLRVPKLQILAVEKRRVVVGSESPGWRRQRRDDLWRRGWWCLDDLLLIAGFNMHIFSSLVNFFLLLTLLSHVHGDDQLGAPW